MATAWIHAWPTIIASFLASIVEFVEALTVVLAVDAVRGWRNALTGAAAALAVLLAIVALFGPLLTRIPLKDVQLVVGGLLLLFGLRWTRKAILRAAGVIALHDEEAAFRQETASLKAAGGRGRRWDTVALATAFKITVLEGIEVVFVVIAIGAGGADLLYPASLGALCALLVVIMLGLLLHRPLSMVPENTLKFVVGVLLTAFGVFWVGEGMGLEWPGANWSLLGLTAGFLCLAVAAVSLCRRVAGGRPPLAAPVRRE
jgi:uncharacterized membrane protein